MALLRFKIGTDVQIDNVPYRLVEPVNLDYPGAVPSWLLKCLVGQGNSKVVTVLDLKCLYQKGALRALHPALPDRAAEAEIVRRQRIQIPENLKGGERKRRLVRAEFIRRMEERIGFGGVHSRLTKDDDRQQDSLFLSSLGDVNDEMQQQLRGIGLHDRRKRNADGTRVLATPGACKPGDGEDPTLSVVRVDASTYYRWRKVFDPDDHRGLEGRHAARGNRAQMHPVVRETVVSRGCYGPAGG